MLKDFFVWDFVVYTWAIFPLQKGDKITNFNHQNTGFKILHVYNADMFIIL